MKETVLEKLKVLAESAKYDVSCASSGVTRKHRAGGVGSAAGWGICHSFTADGRCVSLLKIMLTNVCIYDCAYCINRRSNDIPRAAFTPGELAELTIEFYRRNYIEGLFLSSGVVRDPDYTMERMVRVARDLRTVHRFNGYISTNSLRFISNILGLVIVEIQISIRSHNYIMFLFCGFNTSGNTTP
jgi:predicted DNA-binding helix-hairpin-helix protein